MPEKNHKSGPGVVPQLLACLLAWVCAGQPASARETLEITIHGRQFVLDVHPAQGIQRGAAILSHGFTRSRGTLGGHAAALAAEGVLAITPDLPYTFDFRRNAQALAELVVLLRKGGTFGPPAERVMLVGFSAGALSSLLAAATPGVVGYVGLDPFDRKVDDEAEALGLAFSRQLKTEAILLRAPPSSCNARSVAAPWAKQLPALLSDGVIEGASHCDFESPSDWMCRLACGSEDAARQTIVRDTLLRAAARWMPAAKP